MDDKESIISFFFDLHIGVHMSLLNISLCGYLKAKDLHLLVRHRVLEYTHLAHPNLPPQKLYGLHQVRTDGIDDQ
jgi:hypothetical protein